MNDKQLKNKIQRDAEKVKDDVSTLVGDSSVQIGRIEDNINHATSKAGKDMTTWVEDGIRDTSVTGVQTCALPIYPAQRDKIQAALRL